ncbi:MAG: hypothetical protein IT372_14210 [Polyangiaceae bacterium]|nr:hypothetical protein [Polyangiaceae bacterium]
MAKNTYQTYTDETPIQTYRSDFIRRSAMCGAIASRYPDLAAVATEANAVLGQIDARLTGLQQAEDDQIRAKALEDVAKLDVIDVYAELRGIMAAKGRDVITLLPDAPSALGRLGAKTFRERADRAVANLEALPDGDALKADLLPKLQQELAAFGEADVAEDATRGSLQRGKMALLLYKTELSQVREAQLGAIQKVFGDRERTAQFTIPWRKTSKKSSEESDEPEAAAAPGKPPTP